MVVISKFNENDRVWFVHQNHYYFGIVKSIHSWHPNAFSYFITCTVGEMESQFIVLEQDMYYSKEELLDNIFIETAELAEIATPTEVGSEDDEREDEVTETPITE